jgi:hypothetical protein
MRKVKFKFKEPGCERRHFINEVDALVVFGLTVNEYQSSHSLQIIGNGILEAEMRLYGNIL